MIDYGTFKERPRVTRQEVQELAQAWVNEPGMQAVAVRIGHLCHVPQGEPFNRFRAELAILAAEQYLQGRATGRSRVVTLPELPVISQGVDVRKPYEVGDPRWKPPTMRQD